MAAKSAAAAAAAQETVCKPHAPRVYTRGVVLGHRRSKTASYPKDSLLRVQNVNTAKEAQFYLGKRVAYVYKAKTVVKGTKFRVMWGKIRRTHGSSGVVRATFKRNLPPSAFGKEVRVFMFPSNI